MYFFHGARTDQKTMRRQVSPKGGASFFSVKCRLYRPLKSSHKTRVFACFCLPIEVKLQSLTISKLMLLNESYENIKR